MENRAILWGYLRRAAVPAVCILLIGYFVSHAVGGPTGVLAWKDYKAQAAALEVEAERAAEAKAALAAQVRLLDPRGVDPDMADELVRRNLNVVRPDEVIVPLDGD